MNSKFFNLAKEKQEAIINSGYSVFSKNSYKKSPMNEIAEAAHISKGLLFFYFTNKKELYRFLLEKAAELTIESLLNDGCYEMDNVFDVMKKGLISKAKIMRQYPDLSSFIIKAFYEKDPEVAPDIMAFIDKYSSFKKNRRKLQINYDCIKPGIDLEMMYMQMYWASEGYLWETIQRGQLDVDKMEHDFEKMMEFWKILFMKEEK